MEMVLVGARRLPARRRRRVVLPAPLAPISRVRLEGGRSRETLRRPREWSGKANVRLVTVMEGAVVLVVGGSAIVVVGGGRESWEERGGEKRRGEERRGEERRGEERGSGNERRGEFFPLRDLLF